MSKDNEGNTPLHHCCVNGHEDVRLCHYCFFFAFGSLSYEKRSVVSFFAFGSLSYEKRSVVSFLAFGSLSY